MSTANNVELVFNGPPTRLQCPDVVELPTPVDAPRIEIGERTYPLRVRRSGPGTGVLLSLALPAETPSGVLSAHVHAGRRIWAASVEIDEQPRVVVQPRALRLSAAPGAQAVARVRVTNAGNVARPVERAQTITLRKADSIARGAREAFGDASGDLVSRLIALGRKLSAEPTREANIDYKADFKSLKIGDAGNVEVLVRLPDEWEQDTGAWTGQLSFLGTRLGVTLDVSPRAPDATKGGIGKPKGEVS